MADKNARLALQFKLCGVTVVQDETVIRKGAFMDVSDRSQVEMLVQIARLLATLDLDEVLWQTIDLTTKTVGAARGTFFLVG